MSCSGKCHTTGAIRHLDVRICCISSTAFWLWHCFEVMNLQRPDFTTPQWHKHKLLPGANSTTPLNPKAMCEYIKDIFKVCLRWIPAKIVRAPKRHHGRHYAVSECQAASVENAAQNALGGWTDASKVDSTLSTAKLNHYDKELPITALHATAGCGPDNIHDHPRFHKQPDSSDYAFGTEYCALIYPKLVGDLTNAIKQTEGTSGKVKTPEQEQHHEHLITFLNCLKFLAKCFFQDVVLLKQFYPNLTAWKHKQPFLLDGWEKWEREVSLHVASQQNTALTGGVSKWQQALDTFSLRNSSNTSGVLASDLASVYVNVQSAVDGAFLRHFPAPTSTSEILSLSPGVSSLCKCLCVCDSVSVRSAEIPSPPSLSLLCVR